MNRKLLLLSFIVLFFILECSPFAGKPVESAEAQSPTDTPSTVATITGLPIGFSETSSHVELNFTMFIIQFDKSSGSSIISAKNGSVLIYYHFMVLQYWNDKVNDWRQAGTFQSLLWTKHDDYHYSAAELFQDASTTPKTNYTITYDIRSDSRVKISIRIESGASRQYRLAWSFDGIVYSSWREVKNSDNAKCQLCFGNETQPYSFIKVDWQDIYEQFKSDIASYSVTTSAQGRKADIYFAIGTVAANSVLTVDPSVVGTSTYPTSVNRNGFYAAGRHFVFYSDSSDNYLKYKSSTDGSTWSSPVTVYSATVYSRSFNVYFDGTYVHIAIKPFDTGAVYYRRGVPNSDGSITWSTTTWQTVATDVASGRENQVQVAVDSTGKPWVTYEVYVSNYQIRVRRSTTTDGTWSDDTTSPFPYTSTFGHGTATYQMGLLLPLSSGKMYIIGFTSVAPYVKGIYYDGSSFTEESIPITPRTGYYVLYGSYNCGAHSAVVLNDVVHYVVTASTSSAVETSIIYIKRQNGSWTGQTELLYTPYSNAPYIASITADPQKGDLYVFYIHHYRSFVNATGTWTSDTAWFDDSVIEKSVSSYRMVQNYLIGVVYSNGTASPYNVKFALMQLNEPKLSQYILDLAGEVVYVQAVYAYDNTPIANANVSYAGLYALTNSTGWAAFNVSSLPNVDWNSISYVVSEPTYSLTVAFHKLQVQPFTVRANNFIGNPVWDDVNRKLSFTTNGTCIVKVADWGQPLRVEVDGAVYTDWTYDSAKQEVTINNLASNVALYWQQQPSGGAPGGSSGGVTPTPGETPVTPTPPPVYVPPEAVPLVNVGLVVIVVVVVGAYAYSQVSKPQTLDQAWRKRQPTKKKGVTWKRRGRYD
jgi:hypothetical protein